jgi:hypothetical protein
MLATDTKKSELIRSNEMEIIEECVNTPLS